MEWTVGTKKGNRFHDTDLIAAGQATEWLDVNVNTLRPLEHAMEMDVSNVSGSLVLRIEVSNQQDAPSGNGTNADSGNVDTTYTVNTLDVIRARNIAPSSVYSHSPVSATNDGVST